MMEQVPFSSILCMIITAVLLLAVPVVYCLLWKKKAKISPAVIITGALGFMISARVLEMIPHFFCILTDNPVSRFINGNTIAYMIYGAMMAGIFEECGRYVIFRFILKKHKEPETSITYGIGHGGFEVLIISLVTVMNYLLMAFMINSMGFEAALTNMGITDATREAALAGISPVFSFGIDSVIVMVLERVLVMLIHISLSVIVFYGVSNKQIRYLFIAIFAHAILDAPAALAQKGACSMIISEVWLLICMIVLVIYAKKLYAKMKSAEIS